MFNYNPLPDPRPDDPPRQPNRLDVQREYLLQKRRDYRAQQDQMDRIDRERPDRLPFDNAVISLRRWFGKALVNIGNWIIPDATGIPR